MAVKGSGFGVTFEVDPAGGTSYTLVAAIQEITPPGEVKATLDVTTHDSPGGYEELTPEQVIRSEDIEMTIIYDPNDASHIMLLQAVRNNDPSIVPNCRFSYPPSYNKKLVFKAIFLSFTPATPMEGDPQTAVVVIHRTGAVTEE